jgi:hypothetical protein
VNGIVPFSVKGVWRNIDAGQFLVGDDDARLVVTRVQGGAHFQAGARRGAGDEIDDRPVADQRTAAPVLGDKAEETMLDLVPLARAGRKVAHLQLEPQFVRERLERHFPEPIATAVAAAAVGHEHQLGRLGETLPAHLPPPTQNARGGELRGVMIDPDADPALVARQVVDPIGNRLAQFLIDKVVHLDLHRFSDGRPFPAGVAKLPNQFLLFRINGDHGLVLFLQGHDLPANVLELRVAVWMRRPFPRLAIGL